MERGRGQQREQKQETQGKARQGEAGDPAHRAAPPTLSRAATGGSDGRTSKKRTDLPAQVGELFVDSLERHRGGGEVVCGYREGSAGVIAARWCFLESRGGG